MDKRLKFESNSYWVKILKPAINVTLTLADNNVPFKGDSKSLSDGDDNSGDFVKKITVN